MIGFIVGSCLLTALGLTFSGNLLSLTDGSVFMTLLLSMLACLILGMGLPTTANYIVTCTLIAPALIKLGVPALAANLFVFYFGIKAGITPPVCLATYTAAGLVGFCIALPSFFLPYMFVYEPAIMWHDGLLAALYTSCFAVFGICGITAFAGGWLGGRLNLPVRLICLAVGVACFRPETSAHWTGAALVFLLWLFGTRLFSDRKSGLKAGEAMSGGPVLPVRRSDFRVAECRCGGVVWVIGVSRAGRAQGNLALAAQQKETVCLPSKRNTLVSSV